MVRNTLRLGLACALVSLVAADASACGFGSFPTTFQFKPKAVENAVRNDAVKDETPTPKPKPTAATRAAQLAAARAKLNRMVQLGMIPPNHPAVVKLNSLPF